MKNRRFRHNRANPPKPNSLKLETFSVSEEDHPKFKAAMHEAALAAVADFPKTLELVKNQLRQHDPIGVMACFAGYGLLTIGPGDGSERKPLKDIQQQHAELLQAIMLTIPRDEWGLVPVTPKAMQTVLARKLETRALFARSQGRTVAPAGGNTCAP
jgi:hypothetical protein